MQLQILTTNTSANRINDDEFRSATEWARITGANVDKELQLCSMEEFFQHQS
jgi:hypothetical protein